MKKWLVIITPALSVTGSKRVEADRCAIHEGGVLVFYKDREILRAFAHSAWLEMNLVEE